MRTTPLSAFAAHTRGFKRHVARTRLHIDDHVTVDVLQVLSIIIGDRMGQKG